MAENNKACILIVDDERINIKALSALLCDDYRIKIALSGRKALEIADSFSAPDLILLDVMMPEMDGYEVCKVIKNTKSTCHIPIIFITGKVDEEDETRGLNLGAVDYITKPFRPAIVSARVKTQIKVKQQSDLLAEMSYLDGLTDIHNRRSFDETLEIEWQSSLRYKRPLSLLMMDIDCFKQYNDFYGHQQGDSCLQSVASCLKNSIMRSTDHIARYGGEEFCVILPETGHESACDFAEKLREKVDAMHINHASSNCVDHITLSIGVATDVPTEGKTAKSLICSADAFLYQAKASGRNKVAFERPVIDGQ